MHRTRFAVGCLALASCLASPLRAQGCSSTLAGDVSTISVSAGGVQTLTLLVSPLPVGGSRPYSIVGSFSGTTPPFDYFAYGGLFLARDRYMDLSYLGRSPFLPGGVPSAPGGHTLFVPTTGVATQAVVVAPGVWTALVGRTVRHGAYTLEPTQLLPSCGSNTVPLTFVP